MKAFIVLSAAFSLSALAGCQSSAVNSTASTLEPAGGQARYSARIPADTSEPTVAQPYALRGTSADAPAAPQSFGYQAR